MVEALELIAESAEAMPAGDHATLDVYTSGAMAMYHCNGFNPCLAVHEWLKQRDITIEPYKHGMGLDGGLNLYGDRNTAILNDPSTGLDIHHHNLGGGSLNFGNERISNFPWERQTKLPDYLK